MPAHPATARCGFFDRRGKALVVACGLGLLVALVPGARAAAADDDAGRMLFTEIASPPCKLCHTLAAAGATGTIGPSLDELKPDADRVTRAVKQGVGVMPPFEALTDEQVAVLARYVARVSGGSR